MAAVLALVVQAADQWSDAVDLWSDVEDDLVLAGDGAVQRSVLGSSSSGSTSTPPPTPAPTPQPSFAPNSVVVLVPTLLDLTNGINSFTPGVRFAYRQAVSRVYKVGGGVAEVALQKVTSKRYYDRKEVALTVSIAVAGPNAAAAMLATIAGGRGGLQGPQGAFLVALQASRIDFADLRALSPAALNTLGSTAVVTYPPYDPPSTGFAGGGSGQADDHGDAHIGTEIVWVLVGLGVAGMAVKAIRERRGAGFQPARALPQLDPTTAEASPAASRQSSQASSSGGDDRGGSASSAVDHLDEL